MVSFSSASVSRSLVSESESDGVKIMSSSSVYVAMPPISASRLARSERRFGSDEVLLAGRQPGMRVVVVGVEAPVVVVVVVVVIVVGAAATVPTAAEVEVGGAAAAAVVTGAGLVVAVVLEAIVHK